MLVIDRLRGRMDHRDEEKQEEHAGGGYSGGGLGDAERYAVAALFTLAIHSTAAVADGGIDDWGYDF